MALEDMPFWPAYLTPPLGLLGTGFVALLLTLLRRGSGPLTCRILLALLAFVFLGTIATPVNFSFFAAGSLVWDRAARIVDLLAIGAAALLLVLNRAAGSSDAGGAGAHSPRPGWNGRPVAALAAALGATLLGGANDLVLIWVALELISAALLLWLCAGPLSAKAFEATVKLFVLSAVAGAFLLLGIAYVAGSVGATRLDAVEHVLQIVQEHRGNLPLGFKFGALCCFIGLAIRFAWVPFHYSAPDAGEGLPIGLTAFLQTVFFASGLLALMRLVLSGLGGLDLNRYWVPPVALVAGLTLAYGHLLALPQRNLRRLLAYLAIGQAGLALVALLAASPSLPGAARPYIDDAQSGQSALLLFLVVHALTFSALYLTLDELDRLGLGGEIHHLTGLSRRSPVLAGGLALGLICLAGLPPFAGFLVKTWILLLTWNRALNLLTFGLLLAWMTSLSAILGPIKAMFWSEPIDEEPLRPLRPLPWRVATVAALLALLLIGGFWPGLWSGLLRGPEIDAFSLQTAPPLGQASVALVQ